MTTLTTRAVVALLILEFRVIRLAADAVLAALGDKQ